MAIVLVRIDDRLIHGQVVVGWSSYLNADHIVVASDEVVHNPTQKMLYEMVVPADIKVSILTIKAAVEAMNKEDSNNDRTILLFENPRDVLFYCQSGGPVKSVNVGGMRYEPNKKQIAQAISVDDEDLDSFRELDKLGIELEGRAVPTETPIPIKKYL